MSLPGIQGTRGDSLGHTMPCLFDLDHVQKQAAKAALKARAHPSAPAPPIKSEAFLIHFAVFDNHRNISIWIVQELEVFCRVTVNNQ